MALPLWSPLLSWSIGLTVLLFVITGLHRFNVQRKLLSSLWPAKRSLDKSLEYPYTSIEPISDFKWDDEAPIALRPFKPKYNLTMALQNMTMDDLVMVDNTYLDRIQIRRRTMQEHPSTIGHRPGSETAVAEFYTWMTRKYLPQRFPSMYRLNVSEQQGHLQNLVTSENIPLQPSSVHSALHTLSAHVDTDFIILLPCPQTGKYHLEAFVTCFPAGFSTIEKLGLPLAAIHKPVPGYAAKLEKSMDRFFTNLPVGRIVRRANWSISTNDNLYSESGNHLYDGEDENHASPEQEIERQKSEVVIEDCRLRCERQTLHRLPQSKALVFGMKTYLYTLAEVKAEGNGPDLAAAADGLGLGNVPDMKYYKRGVVWGERVKEYLLS